jgi:ribonuclease VapC
LTVTTFVLDASAVIALIRGEPGADFINERLVGAAISAVNLQEVVKELLDQGVGLAAASTAVLALSLDVIAHDADDALAAADLAKATRKFGRGIGDRSCMALAIRLGVPALTTDRAWAQLAIPGLTVLLAR